MRSNTIKQLKALIVVALFASLIFCQITSQTQAAPSGNLSANISNKTLPFLHTQGDCIVNENGEEVYLRGVNIGGWLLIEPWMMGKDWEQFETEKDLWDSRYFSNDGKPNLTQIRTFRDNWFTENDTEKIADEGMNCVRLPIWWRATNERDNYDGSFKYVNQCIQWCKKNNLYVIIDMHGAPGGQNSDNKGERRDSTNDLWNSCDRQNQFIEWWKRVANLYKNESTVAAYDLLNEGTPPNFDEMIKLYNKTYNEIRKIDQNHIIVLEVGMHSPNLTCRMPSPKENNWTNIMYSFHYYPWGPDNGTKALNVTFPCIKRQAMEFGIPIFVGEFNVIDKEVNRSKNYTDVFKNYIDIFDSYGWSWTFWTYKKIDPDHDIIWGLYGLVDNALTPDFNNSTTIEYAFKNMHTNYTRKQDELSNVLKLNTSKVLMPIQNEIDLNPCNVDQLQPNSSIQNELCNDPPNLGYWKSGERAVWSAKLDKFGNYAVSVEYATPHNNTMLSVQIDNKGILNLTNIPLNRTGNCTWKICSECNWNCTDCHCYWQNYTMKYIGGVNISELNISEGEHKIRIVWEIEDSEINNTNNIYAGNLYRVLFRNLSC